MPSERKLHPAAIVFGAGQHVKRLALPLVLAVIGAGRGSDLWTYVLAGVITVIVLHGVLHYATFRYRLDEGELVVRSGIVVRSERHVPYARIHNLDVAQHLVHRLFRIVEVRIQTGGGAEPEVVLRAIGAPGVDELRARVRGTGPDRAPPDDGTAAAVVPAARDLIALPVRELVLAGLVELRGIALAAAGLGLVWELALSRVSGQGELAREVVAWVRANVAVDALLVPVAITAVLVVIATLSVGWAIVRFYDFRVRVEHGNVQVSYGLLTRITAAIPLHRVQSLTIAEGPFHRMLGRVAVDVASAGGVGGKAGTERARLAPILPVAALLPLVHEVVPDLRLDALDWQPLAPRAGRRLFKRSAWLAASIAALSALVIAWWSLAVLVVLLALAALHARGSMRHARWAIDDTAVAFRHGWLWRRTTVVRRAKVQVVALRESPFDRRHVMARLGVDTAGTTVSIPYLPHATAAQLHATLATAAARTEFRW